jgi:pimeloyl-ACP methyl ester carboxylesterase
MPTVATVATQPVQETGPREATFQTEDGVTLSGTLFGQGQVGVVLSHMYPTDQTSWHAFAQTLADNGYLALAYDFRGYGQSGGEKRIDQIDRDVRAAAEFLRGQGAQRTVLIGASMGGMASAKVAGSVGADGLIVLSSPQSFQGMTVTADDLKSFAGPSLWIGSRGDAATADTEAMHALANAPKTIHIYSGSAHGTYIFDTGDEADLIQRLLEFLLASFPPE